MTNKAGKLIKESDFDPNRRLLAARMIQGTLGMLSATKLARAENISGLVKAAVHSKVHDLPDKVVELGLNEPNDAPVGRLKRWVTQATLQVTRWSKA